MRRFHALAAAALLAAMLAPATPALAQSLELNGRKLTLSPHEMKVLGDLRLLLTSSNRGAQDKALAAARSGVQGSDARHVLATYELEIANQRGDAAMRVRALDVLIASDLTTDTNRASYLAVRGQIAFQAGDIAMAKALWTRLLAMKPDDPQVLANLAQVRIAENDPKGAVEMIERATAGLAAAGKPVPEGLYRQRLSIANQAKLPGPGFAAALALVRAYPTPGNWRDALVVYRQLAQHQGGLEIDLLRLMRATGTLTKPAEYQRLAQLLNAGGFAAEAKAVLDDGEARDIIPALDLLTGQIRAEIERTLAKPKPAMPPLAGDEAALHRGMELVAAGRKDEAIAVFRTLVGKAGGYGELAGFWLAWLEGPGR